MRIGSGETGAVVFALLIAISLVATPAVALGPDERGGTGDDDGSGAPGHERGVEGNVSIPQPDANSTVELLETARNRLEELDVEDPEADATREETIASLTESIETYRTDVFATAETTFEHQRDAQEGIEELLERDAGDEALLRNASRDVALASNVSARLATRDAHDTVESYEGAFDNPGQRQKAESHLGNAVDAIERAENASGSNAVTHYRNAWRHAEAALDVVEDNTEPQLSLSRGRAVERNGTVQVVVYLELTDVRPYEYEDAQVSVDDEDTETVDLSSQLLSGGSATGSLVVDVGTELPNRTVTATVVAEHDEDRRAVETFEVAVDESEVTTPRPAPDEYNEVSIRNESSGVTVDIGGEGLHESDVGLRDVTPESDAPYRAGPVVRIQNRTSFDEAEVTIPVDGDAGSVENLSIYKWDRADSSGWRPLETEFDPENGTATATVNSFSDFTVIDEDAWRDYLDETITLEDRHVDGDLEDYRSDGQSGTEDGGSGDRWDDGDFESGWYVQDSGSWDVTDGTATWTGGFDSKDYRTDEVSLDPTSSIHLSFEGYLTDTWAYYIRVKLLDGTDESLLGGEIGHDDYNYRGGLAGIETDTSSGWKRWTGEDVSVNEWVSIDVWYRPEAGECRIVADGPTTNVDRSVDPEDCAGSIANESIEAIEISGWSHRSGDRIRNITVRTDGGQGSDDAELRDSNGDGIPDAVAEANPRIPHLAPHDVLSTDRSLEKPSPRLDIDPYLTDSSGDGLLDNETVDVEYEVFEADNETKLRTWVTDARAHPGRYDTDGDGLSDYEELEVWETNPWMADTSGDGLNDKVDPHPHEKTLPPEFEYETQDLHDFIPLQSTLITTRDDLVVVARPAGSANDIEEIRIHQYVDTWVPFAENGWRNESYMGESLDSGDGVYKKVPFGDSGGEISPEIVEITVVDEDGNTAGVTHDVNRGVANFAAGVTRREAMAYLSVGAVAASSASSATVASATGTAAAGISVGGVVVLGGAGVTTVGTYALVTETTGSASGEIRGVEYIQPIPVTESAGTWETPEGIEITLPSGATYEHEYLDRERRHGWEQIKRLPGVERPEDVGQIIEDGERLPGYGEHDIIIGDNPNEPGRVILRLHGGWVLSANGAVTDPHRGEDIAIPEEAIRHIIEDHDDWDHEVIGRNEQEVRETLEDVIRGTGGEGADEVWEDPNQNRWMYVKELTIDGQEVTVVVFVTNGAVRTAFAPTHPSSNGYEGHSDEFVEYYIKAQEMIKRYAIEGNEVIEDVDVNERPEPIPMPDQP